MMLRGSRVGTGAATPQSPLQPGDEDEDEGQILPLPPQFGHKLATASCNPGFPDMSRGEKSTGSPSQLKAAGDQLLTPAAARALHPGLAAGYPWVPKPFPWPWGAGSRIFGSQSTSKQHGWDEGPTTCIFPALSLCAKVGREAGAKASHAQGGSPCAVRKAKPTCHQGQPKTQRMVGCGRCHRGRAKGTSPRGWWGCKRRRAGAQDEFASLRHNPP